MLEIKNLTKIYKSKGGVKVKALDAVSVKFPENGMVFLLGKSGSGKSTLLNVCGGLDNPTSGEIIVKGRSSVNFKQSDFDSYRNTFIGFIFQEYNILDEFSVEENIALALELQGKEKNLDAINELLEKVDLKGYNNRKPNTLSGGQKQRLAIARALVKSPEIIMADEPTGALDSQTGKQVFDTLKELSENTLVIVVSHDREFAQQYADRIIELKDGKIITDVTKTDIGDFQNTNEKDLFIKEYTEEERKFIKSEFPLRHAIRMSLSSLKVKKIRLAMTIFLCTIAFMMFGLLSTLVFYNQEATFKDSLKTSSLDYIQLTKEYKVNQSYYFNSEKNGVDDIWEFGHFTEDEIDDYIDKYGKDTFGAVAVDLSINVHDNSVAYWVNSIYTYAYLEENNRHRQKMVGSYPAATDEIAISSYSADVIIASKMDDYDTGKTLNVTKRSDLIGKKVKLKDKIYTITGIVDSGEISSEYDTLKKAGKVDDIFFSNFVEKLRDGLHLMAFVSKEHISSVTMESSWIYDNFSDRYLSLSLLRNGKYNFDQYSLGYYGNYELLGSKYEYLKFDDFNNLTSSQALISYDLFSELIINLGIEDEKINDLAYNLYVGGENIEKEEGNWSIRNYSYDEILTKTQDLFNAVKNKNLKLSFGTKLYDAMEGAPVGQTFEFNVVGVIIPKGYMDNVVIINKTNYDKFIDYEINNFDSTVLSETKYIDRGFYDIVYVAYDGSEKATNNFWNIRSNLNLNEYDAKEGLAGSIIYKLDTADNIVADFSKMFFWGGVVLAIFASLLFSNFISVSIANKRREIGILRAIGAKGSDVFKIFFSESIILATVCVLLSSLGTFALSTLFNEMLDFGVSVFVFGIASLLFISLIAIITAFVSTFVPVYSAARKKPIDSIRHV